MSTLVQICNLALSYLGQAGNLTSLDPPDTSAHAKTMARFHAPARRLLLGEHPWSFALKRSGVLVDATSDIAAWAYRYALPSDVLWIVALLPVGGGEDQRVHYVVEGGYLYANEGSVELRYVYDNDNPTMWPEYFATAMARRLAAMTSGTIIRGVDPRLLLRLEENAELAVMQAKQRDGMTEHVTVDARPSWIKARGHGGLASPSRRIGPWEE